MPASAKSSLTITVDGHTYEVPPPSAALGYAVRTIMAETEEAEAQDRPFDVDAMNSMLAEVGIDANVNPVDLLIPHELYVQMLRELDVDQIEIAQGAVTLWALRGRRAAEEFLADRTDPTDAAPKQPQDHKPKQTRTPKPSPEDGSK